MPDDIKKKRIEKLAEKGFQLLREGKFEDALGVSRQLEESRFSAAFDIGAQALNGMGKTDKAIDMLKRGLEEAPECWPNLQLLGNYQSDIGDYEEAEIQYEKALRCDGVWKDSVRLNQAVVANRIGDSDKALKYLDLVEDPDLLPHKMVSLIDVYENKGLAKKVIELAKESIVKWIGDENIYDGLYGVIESLVRVLSCEKEKFEIRKWAFELLEYNEANEIVLTLIRDLDDEYSNSARYYRVIAHCMIPFTNPLYKDAIGYFITYDVVADSENEALVYIKKFEGDDFKDNLIVEESEILKKTPNEPKGVYWYSERNFYQSEE